MTSLRRVAGRLRPALRQAAFLASHRLGGPRLVDAFGGQRVVILTYHGIRATDETEGIENWYGYNVPVARFAPHLEYVARRCHVVPLSDALAGRGLSARRTNVVLTFDDGYENNFGVAFPVLRRLGLPAAFALTTGFVRDRIPLWNDILEFAVGRAASRRGRLDWGADGVAYTTEDIDGRVRLFRRLWDLAVAVEQDRRDALIGDVAAQLGVSVAPAEIFARPDYRPLSPEQIAEMTASGLAEFFSHSVRHYFMPRLAKDIRRADLAQSKADVEAWTGRPCTVLGIPGGLYDGNTLDDAFACGYSHVLTSERGDADVSRRVVGRSVVVRDHGLHEFVDLVHGPLLRLAQRFRGRYTGRAA